MKQTERYHIMCSIDAYEKYHKLYRCDDGSSVGVVHCQQI